MIIEFFEIKNSIEFSEVNWALKKVMGIHVAPKVKIKGIFEQIPMMLVVGVEQKNIAGVGYAQIH